MGCRVIAEPGSDGSLSEGPALRIQPLTAAQLAEEQLQEVFLAGPAVVLLALLLTHLALGVGPTINLRLVNLKSAVLTLSFVWTFDHWVLCGRLSCV